MDLLVVAAPLKEQDNADAACSLTGCCFASATLLRLMTTWMAAMNNGYLISDHPLMMLLFLHWQNVLDLKAVCRTALLVVAQQTL